MTVTFHEASVANYLQTIGAVGGFLGKGLAYFQENGIDPQSIVETRLAGDMLPFAFQLHSVVHHSVGAVAGMRSGLFRPPSPLPTQNYEQWQATIAEAQETLKGLTPEDMSAIEGNDVMFELGKMKMPFTATGFLFSFSLPNFYFHAATAYDILRSKGVPLGKRDFMGAVRLKM
ncbi:MAG TPA: DUF1993 domain-containing protein [Rhizomicrobium sp.]